MPRSHFGQAARTRTRRRPEPSPYLATSVRSFCAGCRPFPLKVANGYARLIEYSAEVSRGDPKATAEYNFCITSGIAPGGATRRGHSRGLFSFYRDDRPVDGVRGRERDGARFSKRSSASKCKSILGNDVIGKTRTFSPRGEDPLRAGASR